jgi:hypothetical protein
MPHCRRTVTPRALEARRQNARKSTGPRTEAGKERAGQNARQSDDWAHSPLRTILALEEDPQEYQALLAELVAGHRPANSAQRLLVEDIALLRWRKLRNQRAQEGLILKNLERLERERLQRASEIAQESSDFPQQQALEIGLINIQDSPAKFKELARLLDLLLKTVRQRDFSQEGYDLLANLYGPQPSIRGARILTAYQRFLSSDASEALPEETSSDENGGACAEDEEGSPEPAANPSSGPDEEAGFHERFFLDLQLDLMEARRDVNEKYLTYLQQHVPTAPAVRDEALAPIPKEWHMLLRQEQLLDQQIERKSKLLLYMQWAQRVPQRKGPPYTLRKNEAD